MHTDNMLHRHRTYNLHRTVFHQTKTAQGEATNWYDALIFAHLTRSRSEFLWVESRIVFDMLKV